MTEPLVVRRETQIAPPASESLDPFSEVVRCGRQFDAFGLPLGGH